LGKIKYLPSFQGIVAAALFCRHFGNNCRIQLQFPVNAKLGRALLYLCQGASTLATSSCSGLALPLVE
jgi:hypothetical protein